MVSLSSGFHVKYCILRTYLHPDFNHYYFLVVRTEAEFRVCVFLLIPYHTQLSGSQKKGDRYSMFFEALKAGTLQGTREPVTWTPDQRRVQAQEGSGTRLSFSFSFLQ